MDLNQIIFRFAAHMGEYRNAFGVLGNLIERDYLEDIGINGR
jgi:hypothetical protein